MSPGSQLGCVLGKGLEQRSSHAVNTKCTSPRALRSFSETGRRPASWKQSGWGGKVRGRVICLGRNPGLNWCLNPESLWVVSAFPCKEQTKHTSAGTASSFQDQQADGGLRL